MLLGFFLVQTNLIEKIRNIQIIGWTTLIFGVLLYISDKFKIEKNIENNLNIEVFDKYDNFLESYSFKGFSTYSKPNNLPFQLIINDTIKDDFEKLIQIKPHSLSLIHISEPTRPC